MPKNKQTQAEIDAKIAAELEFFSMLQKPKFAKEISVLAARFGMTISPEMVIAGAQAASTSAQAGPTNAGINFAKIPGAHALISMLQTPEAAEEISALAARFGMTVSPEVIMAGAKAASSNAQAGSMMNAMPANLGGVFAQAESAAKMPGAGFLAAVLQFPPIALLASALSPLTGTPLSPFTIISGAKVASMYIKHVNSQEEPQSSNKSNFH